MGEVIKLKEDLFSDPDEYFKGHVILRVPKTAILNLLFPPAELNISMKIDLPDDVKVNNVWYDPATQDFCFMLQSDQYEIVKPGWVVPSIGFTKELVRVISTAAVEWVRN